ncbi:hypothetical protein EMCRGX_G002410 [Ephydatia muelleri]
MYLETIHCSPGVRNKIFFYNRGEPYFEFTNFAEYPIQLDGKTWRTTEHYFQAQKFVGTPYEEVVRTANSAREAFSLSRQPQASQWLRKDWEQVKVGVMYKALVAKFSQHSELRATLLGTRDSELVEHTKNDSFWGDGGDGSGQNQLGQQLMRVRGPSKRSDCCLTAVIAVDSVKGVTSRMLYEKGTTGDKFTVFVQLPAIQGTGTRVITMDSLDGDGLE